MGGLMTVPNTQQSTPDNQVAVECLNIGRTFFSRSMLGRKQQTEALRNLSFTVPRRSVFGLLGPNGAGKTTTIRILSTLLTPTVGQARVLGFDVVSEASKVRGRIGLILGGERGFYGRLSGVENLRYFAALNHLGRDLSRKRIEELLEMVGLASASDRPVEQYSRGMRQRLHVARGLLAEPELLFMDEPTIGLDPLGAQEVRQLIPELVRRGMTVLLTTHYMFEADEVCDQIAIINRGEIVASGTPSKVKRGFSKVAILEVLLRQSRAEASEELTRVPDVERVISSEEGPFQKLTIHASPGRDIRGDVTTVLGQENVESIVVRDPTLEEAYLSIIR